RGPEEEEAADRHLQRARLRAEQGRLGDGAERLLRREGLRDPPAPDLSRHPEPAEEGAQGDRDVPRLRLWAGRMVREVDAPADEPRRVANDRRGESDDA